MSDARTGRRPIGRRASLKARTFQTITYLLAYFGAALTILLHGEANWALLLAVPINSAMLRLATMAHELGHAVAGSWCSGRVIAIALRPVELRLRPLALRRARPNRWGRSDRGGGYTLCLFPKGRHGDRYLVYLYGGVAGNTAAALLAAAVARWVALPTFGTGLVWAMAIWNGWQAASNLVTYPGSDGARIASVRHSAALRRRIVAHHRAWRDRPRQP